MISKLFFDNDCISSFLWVKEESILFILYPGRIVLPSQVYIELCNPSIRHLKHRIDQLCLSDKLSIKEILLNTEEYHLYHGLAEEGLVHRGAPAYSNSSQGCRSWVSQGHPRAVGIASLQRR